MRIQTLTKDELFKELDTTEDGLTIEEAKKRLSDFGENVIYERKRKSRIVQFLSHLTDLIAILLWIAGFLAIISSIIAKTDINVALALFGVIFINAIFTFFQEYKAEKAAEALKKLIPSNVTVVRKKELMVPTSQIVPGDIIKVKDGDRVPADTRLFKAIDLEVDNSSLTGESEPQKRKADPVSENIEADNIIYAGTIIVKGNGIGVVFAIGNSTEFGKVAHLTQGITDVPTPLQRELKRATKIITILSIVMGLSFFLIGEYKNLGLQNNLLFAIGIIVANVPEGLLPALTLSLSLASQRMAKRNVLIKKLSSVETLGSADVICTDKTGTITANKMTLDSIYIPFEHIRIDNLKKYKDKDEYKSKKDLNSKKEKDIDENNEDRNKENKDANKEKESLHELLLDAILCNNARIKEQKITGGPTDAAIFQGALPIIGNVCDEWERIDEIPFSSERKMMSTVSTRKGGEKDKKILYSKGAFEVILTKCSFILKKDTDSIEKISEEDKKKLKEEVSRQEEKGMRLIAFAKKDIEKDYEKDKLESDLVFLGIGMLRDPPRKEVPFAVEKCKKAGIKIIIITGDAELTAKSIAIDVGISKDPTIVTGKQLDKMSNEDLEQYLQKDVIFARALPEHKLRIVKTLKDIGKTVAVTGDGVNDAPALKAADIGVAMGKSGTDVARESADMILMDDNFASIVAAIEEGRAMFDNIRRSITYIFTHLVPEIVPFILFVLIRIPSALTIFQILAIELGTDMAPSIGLGAEKPEPDTMDRPARKKEERILTMSVLLKSYLFLGVIATIASLFGYYYTLMLGGWTYGTNLPNSSPLYIKATTMALVGVVMVQIGNGFACRTTRESLFKVGFFANKYLIAGIIIEIIIILSIVYVPILQHIFSTSGLSLTDWLLLIPFAFILIMAEEFRKWLSKYYKNMKH